MVENQIAVISRSWKSGDIVTLIMPMEIKTSQWYDFARAVERGPLVYALRIEEEKRAKDRQDKYRNFEEVYPKADWNYALYYKDLETPAESIKVEEREWSGKYPWNLEQAPVHLQARGIRLPEWKLVDGRPVFPAWWGGIDVEEEEIPFSEITLVPYGCTTLRITEFPVYGLQ